jgi:sulfatase maturation enzyme AslB (radical SAM superfamily)
MENINFFIKESTKLLKPSGLDTLILYVTSRCNAKCGFCFYGEELNRVPELNLQQIVKVSENLRSLNGLLIGGGEPFLRADLFDIITAFAKNCHMDVVQVPTNGFFTNRIVSFADQITAALPNLDLSIQVSLDAIGEKHDALRQLKGCFKQAEQTIASLKSLRNKNMRLRILVVSVLTPETLKDCRDFALYVRNNIDPDYHWFEPARDMPAMAQNLKLTADTVNFLRDNLKYYLTKVKETSSSLYASRLFNSLITKFSLNNFDIAYDNFIHKKQWPVTCCAGKRMAVLYPDGTLAACELRQEHVTIKDYDFDIHKALKNETFEKVRNDTRKHACDCTHGCFIPTSVRYAPGELLKMALSQNL